jgi:hypothetical protein
MNRKSFKLAACGLMLTLAMPVMGQGTNEYLQPCDIILPKFEAVYSGNIFEDPEGFENQMKSVMNNPRTYDTKCWSIREEPSFEESYEIQCIYNRQSEKFRLELMVQNQQNPHVLDIDEETAYRMQTLIDAAVYSASNLPDKEWMQQKLDNLKSGDGVMASVVGLDGTTYKFFNRRYGAKCWSPGGGNNAALVAIVKALYNAIGYKDIEGISSKLEDIKNLTGKYASQLQDPYREYYLLRIDKRPANWVFDF